MGSQQFVTLEASLFEYFLEVKCMREKLMQFMKQIISEEAHNPVATDLPSSWDISCCFHYVLFILLPWKTHLAPYCLGAELAQCGTTPHILVPSWGFSLAICFLSECLLNNSVCLPLVTNARVNLWTPAGRRNGLPSATTNKFLITDPAICPGFHMARRGAGFCRARFSVHPTSIYWSDQLQYRDCNGP